MSEEIINNNKLYFNSIEIIDTKDGFDFKPNFTCPVCQKNVIPTSKIFAKVAISKEQLTVFTTKMAAVEKTANDMITMSTAEKDAIPKEDKNADFNELVTFTMPCCGTTNISLYVAVHKDIDGKLSSCISVVPINSDWYIIPSMIH